MVAVLERFSLSGRVALITAGAGPLFGSSITEGLAEAGATVITASRSAERNEGYAEELRRRGYDAHAMTLDITKTESIISLRDRVINQFGRIDVLVNNALARVGGDLDSQDAADWEYCAKGDMVGLLSICKSFLVPMLRQESGRIINISSIYGVVASDPNLYKGTDMTHPPSYDFVKAGMIHFTRYLAATYGSRGIRANSISPGGFFDGQPKAFVDAYSRRVPVGRMMNREDIQGAVVFLSSDASEYVNGINLLVDGGWTVL